MAMRRMSMPPPTLNDAMLMPKKWRIACPEIAATSSIIVTERAVNLAIEALSLSLLSEVSPTNTGIAPMGFSTEIIPVNILIYSDPDISGSNIDLKSPGQAGNSRHDAFGLLSNYTIRIIAS